MLMSKVYVRLQVVLRLSALIGACSSLNFATDRTLLAGRPLLPFDLAVLTSRPKTLTLNKALLRSHLGFTSNELGCRRASSALPVSKDQSTDGDRQRCRQYLGSD